MMAELNVNFCSIVLDFQISRFLSLTSSDYYGYETLISLLITTEKHGQSVLSNSCQFCNQVD